MENEYLSLLSRKADLSSESKSDLLVLSSLLARNADPKRNATAEKKLH